MMDVRALQEEIHVRDLSRHDQEYRRPRYNESHDERK